LHQVYFERLSERESTDSEQAKLKTFRESVEIQIDSNNQLLIEDYKHANTLNFH